MEYRTAIANFIRTAAQPADKCSHQPWLFQLAKHDDDVLYAAWMQDLGVFVGHRPEDPVALALWDSAAYAVQQVSELLQRFGFPKEKIPAVVEAIRTHLPSGRPDTVGGVLLQDAELRIGLL